MKPAAGLFLLSKVCAEGLEYNAESEVSLMHTLTIIVRFHKEPMNSFKATKNMRIT